MTGKILTNGVDPLDNFKKFIESGLIEEDEHKNYHNSKKASYLEANYGTLGLKEGRLDDKVSLETIQEEDKKDRVSSDDLGALTSESDSDNAGSSSESSEEPVIEYDFNINKEGQLENVESSPKPTSDEERTFSSKGDISCEETKKESNRHCSSNSVAEDALARGSIRTNDFKKDHTHTTILTTNDSLPMSSLQVINDPLDDHKEPSTNGSSDVVFGLGYKEGGRKNLHETIQQITTSEKEQVNNSGSVSDESDMKDQRDIVAELQKIVQNDHHVQQMDSVEKIDTSSSVGLMGETSLNASAEKNCDAVAENECNDSKVPDNNDKSCNNDPLDITSENNKSGAETTKRLEEDDSNKDGSVIGTHMNNLADATQGVTQDIDELGGSFSGNVDSGYHTGADNGYSGQTYGNNGDGPSNTKAYNSKEQSRNENSETKAGENLKNKANMSNETQTHAKSTSDQSTALNNGDASLNGVERKLLELEKSNMEQTAEISRLKGVNDLLKTKFEKLEELTGHHHDVENKMLKRNEELEKHLLGLLKSQEIIFDMKERLNAATNDNKQLSKDYEEAVKALEAVDKLFGQKDALVQKWKEATEDSRRLVELLKKHNAEIADLEEVDKLKEDIANLQKKLSSTEQINEENCKKNGELVQQAKVWKKKFEHENERAIKLGYELQEAKKELKTQQKLAAKRGRKNQLLHLEITELKDTLKVAREKIMEYERRLKELETKNSCTQETYTSIIHEKEKQHSVLIKNSETYQQDLVANIKIAEGLREEIDSLKKSIFGLESEKTEVKEKLTNSEKNLEETLAKHADLSNEFEKMQSELEKTKIAAVDNELYTEEQAVQLQEMEEQYRELQGVLQDFIYSDPRKHKRNSSHGKKLRPSHSAPIRTNLEMYRRVLPPPKSMKNHRRNLMKRIVRQSGQLDEDQVEGDQGKVSHKVEEPLVSPTPHPTLQHSRPKSTYGNRSLSSANAVGQSQLDQNRDWVPKIVLVDSKKFELGCENESGSISADQSVMDYVNVGDTVMIELPVDGRKQNLPGVVKYVGPVYHRNFSSGIYAGLKLDLPVGDTNGTVDGRMYFRCLKKHGKFIKLSHILAVQNPKTHQFTTILPVA